MFGGLVVADGFGAFGKMLIFLGAAVAIIAAHNWFERDFEHAAEYPVLILLSCVGMAVMVSATSLMSLYVGLELQSLSAYVLAAYRRTDDRSAEAGLKYFVLGGLASGILLYGISACSTASPARSSSTASPPPSRATGRSRSACCSGWCSCSPASRSRSARCRSTCGPPTSTKARRPR